MRESALTKQNNNSRTAKVIDQRKIIRKLLLPGKFRKLHHIIEHNKHKPSVQISAIAQLHQLTHSLYELYRLLPSIISSVNLGAAGTSSPPAAVDEDDDGDNDDDTPPAPGSFAYDNWCYRHNPNHPHACACQRKF